MRLLLTVTDSEGRTTTHQIPNDGSRVVKVSERAALIELPDGSRYCSCPYLCLATYEGCEFE